MRKASKLGATACLVQQEKHRSGQEQVSGRSRQVQGGLDWAASKVECSAGGDKGQAATMIRPRYAAWRVKIREPKASGCYTSSTTSSWTAADKDARDCLPVTPEPTSLLLVYCSISPSLVLSRSTLSSRAIQHDALCS